MNGPELDRTPGAAPRVLSIAGTDPSGGAGIQADLKSIAANGGYAMAVVTALVAQNTQGVRGIHRPPVEFLAEQLLAVSDDVAIDAVKIGMLFDIEVIGTVANWLAKNRPPVVVLDPVMVAASGDRLLNPAAEQALRELIGSADLVTPNLPELAVLVGEPEAADWATALDQGRWLAARHRVAVLVKGGHLDGAAAPDALVEPSGSVVEFAGQRIETRNTHGTGCSLSAAVATLRVHTDWVSAIRLAKGWLADSIAAADGLRVGQGNGPVSHFAGLWARGGQRPATAESVVAGWWDEIGPIRNRIDDLPFVRGLAEGTLDESAFVWYLAQDALYLRDYSRVLALASLLAPTAAEQAMWASSAHGAIATELELHGRWLPADAMFEASAGEVTTGYVNHLLAAAARGSYPELIAALLPCFWIYADVGSRLVTHARSDNPYAAWLQTYGDPHFEELNRQAISLVGAAAAAASEQVRERMRAAFVTSARYELDFFAAPLNR